MDFADPRTYADALKGVDRVFLMRPPQMGRPGALKPFIRAMQTYGIRFVYFLSLLGVEKNPVAPHRKIEKLIAIARLPYCHISPSFFMKNLSGIHYANPAPSLAKKYWCEVRGVDTGHGHVLLDDSYGSRQEGDRYDEQSAANIPAVCRNTCLSMDIMNRK